MIKRNRRVAIGGPHKNRNIAIHLFTIKKTHGRVDK